jgi:hypothetical protein
MLKELFDNKKFLPLDPEPTSMNSVILVLEPPEGVPGTPVTCVVSWRNETTDTDIMWELAKYGTLIHSLHKSCEELEPLWKVTEGGRLDLVGPQSFLEEWISNNAKSISEREVIPTILNNWPTLVVLSTGLNPDLVTDVLSRKAKNYHITINLGDYIKHLLLWARSHEELVKELEEVALIHARKKWLEAAEDEAIRMRQKIFSCVPVVHTKQRK